MFKDTGRALSADCQGDQQSKQVSFHDFLKAGSWSMLPRKAGVRKSGLDLAYIK
jgi:hypothetical protein